MGGHTRLLVVVVVVVAVVVVHRNLLERYTAVVVLVKWLILCFSPSQRGINVCGKCDCQTGAKLWGEKSTQLAAFFALSETKFLRHHGQCCCGHMQTSNALGPFNRVTDCSRHCYTVFGGYCTKLLLIVCVCVCVVILGACSSVCVRVQYCI